MSQQNKKPVKSFRSGKVEASIWQNEVNKDGQTYLRYSVRIQKRFRKDDGSYGESNYYFPEELARLLVCVQRALEFTTVTESEDSHDTVPI